MSAPLSAEKPITTPARASPFCTAFFASLFATLFVCDVFGSDLVLFDGRAAIDSNKIRTTDAAVAQTNLHGDRLLVVRTGHQQEWPGITLLAPQGHWDLTHYAHVAIKARNSGSNDLTLSCRVDNPGADGREHCVSGSFTLRPSQVNTLNVLLKRASDDKMEGKLFGMRGYPVKRGGTETIDASNITQILLFVPKPSADGQFEVEEIRATGTYVPPTAWVSDAEPFFPFIDTFGQYRHKSWPGKTMSMSDLESKRELETKELVAMPGPSGWDKYGGSAGGPQLRATGFFRTEKVKGKWWLVDPAGHIFFSHGVDCVRALDSTPISERETWFEDSPARQPEFAEFLTRGFALKGHYAGRSPECFSFAGANLRRKYGPDWHNIYPQIIHQRLRSWGLNTIGNWSDEGTRLLRLTPYTDTIGSGGAKMLEGSEGYWGKFPDVFDSSFAEALRRTAQRKRDKSAGDPWCLGFFSDNEMSWGDETSLAIGALRSPPEQAAKHAFIAELKAKYGEIQKLNRAWGVSHASWDALLASREAPDKEKARADLLAFTTRAAEQYFKTARDAIKAVAPNQLYLGCRFAWVNPRAAAAAAKFCDVVSYNLYRRSVADFEFNGGADVPLIIGEFHFGALDRGMFHTGLVPVADQAERAAIYRDYVLGAVRHPQFVGCHWFQFKNEPVTGRVYDEENYQIGLVDVADMPYLEMIEACREVGKRLYINAE